MSPDRSPDRWSDGDASPVDAETSLDNADRPAAEADEPAAQATIAGISRRTFIRGLVVGAIGIPVAVESRTLFGLIDQHFLGGEAHDGTAVASPDSVGVGDELLPETAPTDRLASVVVEATDTGWTFITEIDVENTTNARYELRLTSVETTGGRVETSDATGPLAPGESKTLESSTTIPKGSSPTAIELVGVVDSDEQADRTEARVRLGNVPVKRLS